MPSSGGLLRAIVRRLRRRGKKEAVREAIEEVIVETPESDTPISDEGRLLANILKLRDKTVADVMVPRVDIVGIAADTSLDEVVRLIQTEAHSRYPVYRESLDDVIGMIHIKDVLAYSGRLQEIQSARHICGASCSSHRPCRSSTCCSTCAARARTWRWSSTSSAAPTGC